MDRINVAVLGLGIEGKNAVKSLLDYGNHVYGSDLNKNICLTEFNNKDLDFDLGLHDLEKINSSDAVVLSPGIWHTNIAKSILNENKLLSDVITAHRSVFTIAITGTNGKTTTCYMLKDILEKSGLNILLGGNAGGGFDGYTKLILEASENKYDVMIVEVCDMTLDYASYVFNIDMVIVTNIGYDHMDHHISLENYAKSVCKFLNGKKQVILNGKDPLLMKCVNCADKTFLFDSHHRKLKLFGKFNQENASGAFKAAELLGISPTFINKVLSNFNDIKGRTTSINFMSSKIIIGKTDNPNAAAAVFSESKMDVIMIGTPRKSEEHRYNILKEVKNANPDLVILFPGLDNTTDIAKQILKNEGYDGKICILNDVSQVIEQALKCTKKYKNIFIGGNGQKKIIYIQNSLNEISNSSNK
jgi:UDP-N-acetylmuramoylalanine--D-glutamate ligase